MEEYIVSARKYRPMSFDTVVGQSSLTTTLKNAVKSGKLAHAYLFCGPRGVGKTTCARIFAKAINCQNPTAEGEACGECESCQSFDEQRSLNIFELDAASNNSVEHIKTLMEQTRIPPQVGRYKVFIIDEVHMLSTQAFNAFLKTLEEPPAHVIFILATTEKHKILPTILSRCQIYDFERMTVADTIAHLKSVAEREGITYEEEALAVIAEKADGGMRDALSIFDQAASFCQGNITYAKVIEDLNVLDSENYFRLVDLALENKVTDTMLLLNDIIGRGFDAGLMVQGLARHVRNVMMARDPQTLSLLEVSQNAKERYVSQAQRTPTKFLYDALRLMNTCDLNYRQSSNKRLLVELTLIEIAQLTQKDEGGDATAGSGRKPRRLKSLFTQQRPIVRPEQKAVQQVAAAEVRTKIKTTQLGTSWSSLRRQADGVQATAADDNAANSNADDAENKVFEQAELDMQWLAMCNRMPQRLSGIAQRMKNLSPRIAEMPAVEVTVPNEIVKNEMEAIKRNIVSTLRLHLHNAAITLTINVAEQQAHERILTRKEQFEQLMAQNKVIGKLRELFDLELA